MSLTVDVSDLRFDFDPELQMVPTFVQLPPKQTLDATLILGWLAGRDSGEGTGVI
jgi:hypothetical protein